MPAPRARSPTTGTAAAHAGLAARAHLLHELEPAHDRDEERDERKRSLGGAEHPAFRPHVRDVDADERSDGRERREERHDGDDDFATGAFAAAATGTAGHREGGEGIDGILPTANTMRGSRLRDGLTGSLTGALHAA